MGNKFRCKVPVCFVFCRGRRRLAAGSRTVYRRYLRKFICIIPRVYGGYFKSLSCVIQREFIGTYCSSSGLTADGPRGRARGRDVRQPDGGRWTVFYWETVMPCLGGPLSRRLNGLEAAADGSRSASASVLMGTTTGDDPGPIWTALLSATAAGSINWSALLLFQWIWSYEQTVELY